MAGYSVNALPFIKMHGAGNDYVFVDGFESDLPLDPMNLAVTISNRNFGIGSDGLVLMQPSHDPDNDVLMTMWNADGSQGLMCGNAARCVALWMRLQNRISETCRIATASRTVAAVVKQIDLETMKGNIQVDLGTPHFDVTSADKTEFLDGLGIPGWDAPDRRPFVAVSLGNPHAVLFVHDLNDRLVRCVGKKIASHARFPDGTNVEWVKIRQKNRIEVRVWERGSGETLACGSGACAAAVAAVCLGHCDRDREINVDLPGGNLQISWSNTGAVFLTGPAAVSFQGDYWM